MKRLAVDSFLKDPKVIEAKLQIIQSLQQHQALLTGISPPFKEHGQSYQEALSSLAETRCINLTFPYLGSGIGNGPFVELADGSVKYDLICGVGVHYMGHSHPGLTSAMLDAALCDTVMQGNLQPHVSTLEFSKSLLNIATKNGAPLTHCFLCSSGEMGGENALKMAFQKRAPARRILCLNNCFMGRTLVMAQTTDNSHYREGLPKVVDVDYVPFFDESNPEQSTQTAITILKKHLADHPGEYAAMCFELVLGEGGFYPGNSDFFVALMQILKENHIPILVDEVQSFARTPEPFAFQHFQLDKYVDAVWVGKATQVCAVLFSDSLKPKPGLLGQTYTASSTAIAAGIYILNYLINNGFYGKGGRIVRMQEYTQKGLQAISARHPQHLKGPYGIGAMVGFTPLDGTPEKVKAFMNRLFEKGVIAFYCGKEPVRIRFLLPMGAIETWHMDQVLKIVEAVLLEFK